jgi:hypothetical protein
MREQGQLWEFNKTGESSPARKRIIDRLEHEIQPESDRFFNVGLLIIGIAAGAIIAIPSVASQNIQVALGTLAICLIGGAIICFIAGREINRARRMTRSIVIENVREI